jgi:signal transduction histidine kinase
VRRRLYLQVYLGFLGITLLFVLVGSLFAWWERMGREDRPPPAPLVALAELVAEGLPGADAPVGELERALRERGQRFGVDLSVWDAKGTRLASAGVRMPAPQAGHGAQWIHVHFGPSAFALPLADGRWLGVAVDWRRVGGRMGGGDLAWLAWLALLAGVVALGAHPLARRITRRLERLQTAVDQLGAGDLSARVGVEGRDEVAELAKRFNRAAERIEGLVSAQRRMLASASHELRTPLARLRLAVELLGDARPDLRDEAARDIAELDALIEDLLLAARLTTQGRPASAARVDLGKLLAEECARAGAVVSGPALSLDGDERLLRRLVRNLLDNAHHHGGGTQVEASLEALDAEVGVRLRVADRGPGVPESERERIFEAFYRPAAHSEANDGGVGLGLALVREIARAHRGEARCIARPGGGTIIEVDLRGAPRDASSSPPSR